MCILLCVNRGGDKCQHYPREHSFEHSSLQYILASKPKSLLLFRMAHWLPHGASQRMPAGASLVFVPASNLISINVLRPVSRAVRPSIWPRWLSWSPIRARSQSADTLAVPSYGGVSTINPHQCEQTVFVEGARLRSFVSACSSPPKQPDFRPITTQPSSPSG